MKERVEAHDEAKRLFDAGDYEAAFPLAQRYAELTAKIFGTYHVANARALTRLGAVHAKLERYDAASDAYEQAMEIQFDLADPGDPDILWTAMSAGQLHVDNKKWDRAIRSYRRAIGWLNQNDIADAHTVSVVRVNKGVAHLRRGRSTAKDLATALDLFDQALARLETDEGRDHPEYAAALQTIVNHLTETGHREAAKRYTARLPATGR